MNFGQMKTTLKRLVDRPDMSLALAGEFIQRAQANLERSPVRLGFQKKLLHAVFDGASSSVAVPGDYIEMIDLFTDEKTYGKVVLASYQKTRETTRDPVYVELGQDFLLKPKPAAGAFVHMHYYAEAAPLSADTDENGWTQSATEALLYTAARMAADEYQIEDGPKFQAQADREIQLIQDQDAAEEWAGSMSLDTNPYPNIC